LQEVGIEFCKSDLSFFTFMNNHATCTSLLLFMCASCNFTVWLWRQNMLRCCVTWLICWGPRH